MLGAVFLPVPRVCHAHHRRDRVPFSGGLPICGPGDSPHGRGRGHPHGRDRPPGYLGPALYRTAHGRPGRAGSGIWPRLTVLHSRISCRPMPLQRKTHRTVNCCSFHESGNSLRGRRIAPSRGCPAELNRLGSHNNRERRIKSSEFPGRWSKTQADRQALSARLRSPLRAKTAPGRERRLPSTPIGRIRRSRVHPERAETPCPWTPAMLRFRM